MALDYVLDGVPNDGRLIACVYLQVSVNRLPPPIDPAGGLSEEDQWAGAVPEARCFESLRAALLFLFCGFLVNNFVPL